MMSLPPNRCGFSKEAVRTTEFVSMSTRFITTVVVPRSTASPIYRTPIAVYHPRAAWAVEYDFAFLSYRERVRFEIAPDAPRENPGLASEHGEFDVGRCVQHARLAGESVIAPQERFRLGNGAERVPPLLDFDYALVAFASSAARRGHAYVQRVCVVEQGLPGNESQSGVLA